MYFPQSQSMTTIHCTVPSLFMGQFSSFKVHCTRYLLCFACGYYAHARGLQQSFAQPYVVASRVFDSIQHYIVCAMLVNMTSFLRLGASFAKVSPAGRVKPSQRVRCFEVCQNWPLVVGLRNIGGLRCYSIFLVAPCMDPRYCIFPR